MEAMTMGERRRILTLYERGWPTSRIAEAMGRSRSGVRRIKQRFRERGDLTPQKRGNGRPPKFGQAQRQRLAALVAEQPDATIEELWERMGVDVSRSTIDRHLRALRLTFKKRRSMHRNRTVPTSPSDASSGKQNSRGTTQAG